MSYLIVTLFLPALWLILSILERYQDEYGVWKTKTIKVVHRMHIAVKVLSLVQLVFLSVVFSKVLGGF